MHVKGRMTDRARVVLRMHQEDWAHAVLSSSGIVAPLQQTVPVKIDKFCFDEGDFRVFY